MDYVFNLLISNGGEEAELILDKLERPLKKDIGVYISKIKDVVSNKDFIELIENVAVLNRKRRTNNVKNWEIITYAQNYVLDNIKDFDTEVVTKVRERAKQNINKDITKEIQKEDNKDCCNIVEIEQEERNNNKEDKNKNFLEIIFKIKELVEELDKMFNNTIFN